MRILHTIFTKGLAGTERHVTDLCNFQATTHDVAILVRSDHHLSSGLTFVSWLSPEVEVLEVPSRFPFLKMWWHVHKWNPDIIHCHHKRDAKYIGLSIRNKPKVGTLHIGYQHAYHNLDGLICIAGWQSRAIPSQYKGLTVKIANWVPSAIGRIGSAPDELRQRLCISETDYVIGGIGRFSVEKGFSDLAEAFIRADLPNSCLVIVGDGPEREFLARKFASPRFVFPGAIADPFPYYQLFDLFVLPSRFEPFGLVLLEAMHAQLPIVSTRSEGPREILPENKVLWADPGGIDSLASAMRQTYATGMRKPVTYDLGEFRLDNQAEKIYAFYRQVCGS